MLPVSILYFNLENSFQYFLRYRSSNDIFLKFCQKKKCILPSFDKILFVGSFSLLFSTLNVQSCSLLACKTLLRNPLIGLLAFPDEWQASLLLLLLWVSLCLWILKILLWSVLEKISLSWIYLGIFKFHEVGCPNLFQIWGVLGH